MYSNRTIPNGFSLIELLVAISVVIILAMIVTASVHSVRNRSGLAVCSSNLRQWGAAAQLYAIDNDGRLPPKNVPGVIVSLYAWAGKRGESGTYYTADASRRPLNGYLGITSHEDPVFSASCPADESGNYDIYGTSYGANATHPAVEMSAQDASTGRPNDFGAKLSDIVSPSRFVIMAEKGAIDYGVWGALDQRTLHNKSTPSWNLLFADGHVDYVEMERKVITTDSYTFDRSE